MPQKSRPRIAARPAVIAVGISVTADGLDYTRHRACFLEPAAHLLKNHAAARTVPIRRHHRNYGDDLGDGSLGREAAGSGKCNAGSLHRCRAHILHFLFRLWGLLFLRGGRIVDSGGFSRRMKW